MSFPAVYSVLYCCTRYNVLLYCCSTYRMDASVGGSVLGCPRVGLVGGGGGPAPLPLTGGALVATWYLTGVCFNAKSVSCYICTTRLLTRLKAVVRWATGERLTNRLPKLSLITPAAYCHTCNASPTN